MMADTWLLLLIPIVAFAYAMVGHGGASGYLALLAMAGFAPSQLKTPAFVAQLGVGRHTLPPVPSDGFFRCAVFLALPCSPAPFLSVGGSTAMPGEPVVRVSG